MKRIPEIDPEDMFADTRMSFGDHIEDLRRHLLRAIYGFAVGLLLAFMPFVGPYVMKLITSPVEIQLEQYWHRYNLKIRQSVVDRLKQGEYDGRKIKVPRYKLPIKTITDRVVVMGEDGKTSKLIAAGTTDDPWILIEPDIEEFVESMQDFSELAKPPTLATMSVTEAFMVYFKVCLLTGLVISCPWVFYQIWSFIAAGLYPHEKKLVNVYLPYSVALFLVGVFVCQFLVIPKAIAGLLWFNEWLGIQPDLRLNEWLTFALLMPLVFGISFQTPLVMMFAERIGAVDVVTFRKYRGIAYFVIIAFAGIILPTPDVMTMMFLAGPMWLLYELGIFMCVMRPRSEFQDVDSDSQELIEV